MKSKKIKIKKKYMKTGEKEGGKGIENESRKYKRKKGKGERKG